MIDAIFTLNLTVFDVRVRNVVLVWTVVDVQQVLLKSHGDHIPDERRVQKCNCTSKKPEHDAVVLFGRRYLAYYLVETKLSSR